MDSNEKRRVKPAASSSGEESNRMTFRANAVIDDWAEVLATHLGRPADEIRGRGLSASDFVHGDVTHIDFQDGSTARFAYSFFVVDIERGRVGVFTEHCGYWSLPSSTVRVKHNRLGEHVGSAR